MLDAATNFNLMLTYQNFQLIELRNIITFLFIGGLVLDVVCFFYYVQGTEYIIINPRRACAERVTVVVLCVCMYVCHAHAILAVRAIKSVTKDTVVLNVRFAAIIIIMAFFFKLSYSKVRASFTHLGRGGHL